ncbi:hypothetical protein PSQ19_08555 [Devosia algicola]|uniref:Uncharacterized protein n=1 Tax=Devosia algicola TaxID=3026418 RepID=A0ABY7YSU9_9HYPH|nr:hypothetical protein [Devosia algicola]WDR04044.1 hypothetical protein PSQ19_08555 [Devosia algicola]
MDAPRPKLIVVLAFDPGDDGMLGPAMEPMQFETEDRAKRFARDLADKHAGVIAWSRTADPDLGEFGDPVELVRYGDVPDLE